METTTQTVAMTTYPARPINGGKLDGDDPYAPPISGLLSEWAFEPKYNGWRVWLHVETGACFNRHGKPLSIQDEFTRAIATLQEMFSRTEMVWLDVEALCRRHGLGKGAMIVLDSPGNYADLYSYDVRRELLRQYGLREHDIHFIPKQDEVRLVASTDVTPLVLYRLLQELNADFGCDEFYEGIVAKRKDKPYPRIYSPDKDYPFWIKHRFID